MPTAPNGAPAPHSPRPDDESLAARIRAGDEAAFDELHRRYRRRVFAFALKRTGDPAEAEDITQDVFLQIFRCIAKYEGRSSLRTWIFGIAHHQTCNRYRRCRLDGMPLGEEARRVPTRETGPEGVVDALRALGRCAEALRRHVSPAQRRVFELRYREACSMKAIARATGKTPGAVRVGLLRTRRTLATAVLGAEGALAR